MQNAKTILWILAVTLALGQGNAWATSAFARQTQKPCGSCHINNLELTPEGTAFRLSAYQGGAVDFPFSASGIASITHVRSRDSSLAPDISLPKNDSPILELGSLSYSSAIAEGLGAHVMITGNNANTSPLYGSDGVQTGTHVGGSLFLDRSQIRYAHALGWGLQDSTWGLSINNAPGVQDPWANVSQSDFFYNTSSLQSAWGIGELGPTTMIDGTLDSQVWGGSAFLNWNHQLYAEWGNYVNFHGNSSFLQQGGPKDTLLNSFNPYWRLALNQSDEHHLYHLGLFGMSVMLSRDSYIPGSSGAHYVDVGADAKTQWVGDVHSYTLQLTYINEDTRWSARSVGRNHDRQDSSLWTLRGKASWDYRRRAGASVFGFTSDGSTDNLYWAFNPNPSVITGACNQYTSLLAYCSMNGSPHTSGYGFELFYAPFDWARVVLQQTNYTNFLGGGTFIDNTSGNLRHASDNNLTYLYLLLNY
jgi:hypothetical protein